MPGNMCWCRVPVSIWSNSSVAVICWPAMVPIPDGDCTTSSAVTGRPFVSRVAVTRRHGPVTDSSPLSMCVPMFISS